jgi:lipopolysaccharide biosynthesis glycosyltransferase
VILVDSSVDINDESFQSSVAALRCQIRQLPPLDQGLVVRIQNLWAPHKTHTNYDPVNCKLIQYLKFHTFDPWFKQWDVVFYVDAGVEVYGDLNRMKAACDPSGVFYAHSNGYPEYSTFGTLRGQFEPILDSTVADVLENSYDLNKDSFQSTIMIFDTSLIKNSTLSSLYTLLDLYPIANRNDQGILNLYFYNSWTQLPVRDEQGWLYDFLERDSYMKTDYLILKYPRCRLSFR